MAAAFPEVGKQGPLDSGPFETLIYEVEDGLAQITLNRPERLNAFTGRMRQELIAALDRVDADDGVRALIVTGAGRAFCAGADLAGGGATFDYDARARQEGQSIAADHVHRDGGGQVALRLFECHKPIIGAINGPAVGVGVTMTLPMDIRIAAQDAKFGFVFTRRGIVPEAASTWFLPRLVGVSRALEWCMSGRVFSAEEALAGNLVRSLHAPEDLLPAARALARDIIDHAAPVSVALTRHMLWRMLGADHPMEAHQIDSRAIVARGVSADAKEGIAAFLEKRPARFEERVSAAMPGFSPWWPPRPFR